jgi:protein-disulfide isomerase
VAGRPSQTFRELVDAYKDAVFAVFALCAALGGRDAEDLAQETLRPRVPRLAYEEIAAIEDVGDEIIARDLESAGRPAFVINGRVVVGSMPYESFQAIVEEELAKPR